MKVSAALARAVHDLGTDVLFGLAGDANLFMLQALVGAGDVAYVSAAHEAAAVAMASGYAHAKGGLGVATVTHGPGLTNTTTALIEAAKSAVPMLLIAGDTSARAPEHLQNIPQQQLVSSTGAGFDEVRSADTAVEDLAAAARRAQLERRPVVLNVPIDFQDEDVEYTPPALYMPPSIGPAAEDALDAALGVMASARRPVILAGRGAIGARDSLLDLARTLGAPVATSLRAKDLFRGEPADLGILGTFASPAALEVVGRSDCLVSFGASLNFHTTVHGSLLRGRAVVQCDNDPRQIGRLNDVTAGVVGDADRVAVTMRELLEEAGSTPSPFADEAARLIGQSVALADQSAGGTIDIRTFVREFDRMLPSDRQFVFDGGRFVVETARNLHVLDPSRFIWPLGFGSIGLGVSHAVGAAFGRPATTTVAIVGDGGFMMGGLADVHTSVRHGLGLIIALFNDGSYGAEYIQLRNRGLSTDVSMNAWPDFPPLATALGATSLVVRGPGDLGPLEDALANKGSDETVVIDVRLDPERVPDKYDPDAG